MDSYTITSGMTISTFCRPPTTAVAMGAHLAPSVANLFLAHWESEVVFTNKPSELVCYRRFTEDLFMIWRVDEMGLLSFMDRLNSNNKNIVLSWKYGKESMVFIDLEITLQEGRTSTNNYCKPTDRNSYIAIDSCHHRPWLLNIPKEQFVHLRLNCTTENDYVAQASLFEKKFIEKGYKSTFIKKEMDSVRNLHSIDLVTTKERAGGIDGRNNEFMILLDYNVGQGIRGSRVLPTLLMFVYKKGTQFETEIGTRDFRSTH